MKRSVLFLVSASVVLLVGLAMAPVAFAADADDIVGTWATAPSEKGISHVVISKGSNGKYLGKIIWLEHEVYAADDEMAVENLETDQRALA